MIPQAITLIGSPRFVRNPFECIVGLLRFFRPVVRGFDRVIDRVGMAASICPALVTAARMPVFAGIVGNSCAFKGLSHYLAVLAGFAGEAFRVEGVQSSVALFVRRAKVERVAVFVCDPQINRSARRVRRGDMWIERRRESVCESFQRSFRPIGMALFSSFVCAEPHSALDMHWSQAFEN